MSAPPPTTTTTMQSTKPTRPKKIPITSSDNKKSKKYTGEKTIPRCSSPSHFLTPEPAALTPHTPHSTTRSHMDALLNSIGAMYYHNSTTAITHVDGSSVQNEQLWVSSEYDKTEYTTFDQLLNPLRQSSPLDNWTVREIALFEAAICAVGKNFYDIAKLIRSKTTNECIEFYYIWKKSSHYYMWKYYGKNNTNFNTAKMKQVTEIQKKLNNTQTGSNVTKDSSLNVQTTDLRASPVSGSDLSADSARNKTKADKLNKRNSSSDDLTDLKRSKTNNNASAGSAAVS